MLKMDSMWIWTVVLLCLTLPRGCRTRRFILAEFQPAGPKMCQIKCELNSNCNHFEFDSNILKCRLYKKEVTNGCKGSSEKTCEEITNSGQINTSHLPRNLQKLTEECQKSITKDMSECVADRKNQLRCIKPEDKIPECGRCTLPGQQKTDYKSCRCQLGCSKKIRGQKATCHRRCRRYGNTFTLTREVGIIGNNADTYVSIINNCRRRCMNARFLCLSYEYRREGIEHRCYLQAKSWLDVSEEEKSTSGTNWEFYHRDCQ